MQTQKTPLPASVLQALEAGNTLEAIKRLHRETSLGLKESKDAIDAYTHGTGSVPTARSTPLSAPPPPSVLPASVMEALQQGNKIQAIRLLREATGLGLKEAKEAVELGHIPATTASHDTPRSGSPVWVIVCAVLALALAYYFLRGPKSLIP
ncbi:ribosomal protein L7/L12 [Armatimonas sp.]|uniref:ribosomal protein L7/L12 n=1 Tax=Armatimonas sp. TaxID=1872638 RepID=UPI0037536495